jgi:hypothetical protein
MACREKMAKLMPSGVIIAPSGMGEPGSISNFLEEGLLFFMLVSIAQGQLTMKNK